ncbi:ATP-binding cassette domain-containing protein [Nevskia soli]|uniref:ATP-binding cassette domain-containing protein n=1 Tax=Nevskia soli TaxID=418856 RepID=UPI0009FF9888|nr:ATP-binding cassette domain-containing protein [Nevskia soli]
MSAAARTQLLRDSAPAGRERPVAGAAIPASDRNGLAVSIRGLEKHYGERQVLRGLSLDIARGSFVAIVGRSGCGKSTLLRIVAGLEQADGGRLEIGAASSCPACEDRPEVRLMFQDARLLPWKSVIDNVRLGLPRSALPAARDALRDVGLEDRAKDWPAALSGGQRQRVALARALVHRPQLLLLDEPLGALDALTRIEMHALIERLWREHGFTALLVTHDVQEAVALADRVVVIEDGAIGLDQALGLARPRARGSQEFAALEDRVLTRVLQQHGADPGALASPAEQIDALRQEGVRWVI